MTTIELVVYGVFSGVISGGLASLATFLLIQYSSRKVYKKIENEAKVMSEQMKMSGLDQINSNMMGQSNKKPWN